VTSRKIASVRFLWRPRSASRSAHQRLMLDDGGTGLPDERNGIAPGRVLFTGGTFSRLRYSQININAQSATTTVQLTAPKPKKTVAVQLAIGMHIAVLEEETHKEYQTCRIRPRWCSQSAAPMLHIPKIAATTCTVKISTTSSVSSLIGATRIDPDLIHYRNRGCVAGPAVPSRFQVLAISSMH